LLHHHLLRSGGHEDTCRTCRAHLLSLEPGTQAGCVEDVPTR
jgi:hypothetical protein